MEVVVFRKVVEVRPLFRLGSKIELRGPDCGPALYGSSATGNTDAAIFVEEATFRNAPGNADNESFKAPEARVQQPVRLNDFGSQQDSLRCSLNLNRLPNGFVPIYRH